ncbi:hypothetical protein [Sphingomonas sp. LHG3406-1]|uniref:hypothetical protein n=1 Tax=Sphingomonas sp. LHG3406-1 TaxID=2804617 RepID=UPI002616F037|nr:hypothetical protein [Sphingomonas sp. LHG3406-1]
MILPVILVAIATAPSGKNEWREAVASDTRQVLQAYARCSAKLEPDLAARFVLMNDGERLPERDFRRLFDGKCLGLRGGQMRMRAWRSRAALAEALIVRNNDRFKRDSFASVPPLEWTITQPVPDVPTDAAAAQLHAQVSQAEAQHAALGECVSRADPVSTLAVLKSKIDSDDEMAKLKALAPRIAGCVQQGQTLAFNRTHLRAGMALAYYRLAAGPTGARPTAGTN